MVKMLRQSILPLMLLLTVFGVTVGYAPPASAQTVSIQDCTPGANDWDYTTRVVLCLSEALIDASKDMAVMLASYMYDTAVAMMVLSLAWFGVQVIGGERQVVQRMISIAIRWGAVIYYLDNVDTIIDDFFDIFIQFLQLFNGGYSPWFRIDELLGKLFGFGPTLAVTQGLLGIIGAALLSSTAGVFIFMAGIMAFFDIIMFIFNVVFTFLMSVTLIAFMFAISPILVPTLIFFYTERYFNKWWHIMVSAALIPMLMFTFLFFFFSIFKVMVADIFEILGFPCSSPTDFSTCQSPDFRAYWKMNQPKFSWVMPADPNFSQEMQTVTTATDLSVPAVQSNVNPLLRRGFDKSMYNTPAVDFGPNHVKIMEELLLALIGLWIVATLMKSVIQKIPNIADDIAGALNRITVEPTQMERQLRRAMRTSPEQMKAKSENISENLKETLKRGRYMASGGKSKAK